MESGPPLVGPDVPENIDRAGSGLDHLRFAYYEQFRAMILKEAERKRHHGENGAEWGMNSLRFLSEWAFRLRGADGQ